MATRAKTNAIRALESRGVPHRLRSYRVDEEHLDALSAAAALGVEPERVFKTLVTRGADGGLRVYCVPGPCELDLKKAALAAGTRKIEMVKVAELLELTGYVRGACSPVGMRKSFPTWIDESALLFEWILVSAGRRGTQIEIAPAQLAGTIGARFADVV
ncbi:MAG: Cys-tRNA(Pro) deacylase [Spirochaetales bacterium]|nr:Cys-tRNA(Pro) deacylase [Spirochaetales bacterium]